mmetsp:Transcript_30019/g.70318  ORF Transcript_30019/g.70318 Transcript_30019/m.70318 type:complete len:215 (+) Transcript_30019:919-1563(+)
MSRIAVVNHPMLHSFLRWLQPKRHILLECSIIFFMTKIRILIWSMRVLDEGVSSRIIQNDIVWLEVRPGHHLELFANVADSVECINVPQTKSIRLRLLHTLNGGLEHPLHRRNLASLRGRWDLKLNARDLNRRRVRLHQLSIQILLRGDRQRDALPALLNRPTEANIGIAKGTIGTGEGHDYDFPKKRDLGKKEGSCCVSLFIFACRTIAVLDF